MLPCLDFHTPRFTFTFRISMTSSRNHPLSLVPGRLPCLTPHTLCLICLQKGAPCRACSSGGILLASCWPLLHAPPNRAQNESYNQASWNPRLDHSSTTVKRTGPGVRPTSWDLLSQFLASTSVYPSIKWECEYLPERVIMRIK